MSGHGIGTRPSGRNSLSTLLACILCLICSLLPHAGRADGSLWGWGLNDAGQVGDGTNVSRWSPTLAAGPGNIRSVVASDWHSMALAADGTVWGWGFNGAGTLGDGTWTNRATPVPTTGVTDAVGLSTCFYSTHVVRADGTIMACGFNVFGQNGLLPFISMTAETMPGVGGVNAICEGQGYCLAIIATAPVR